MQKAKKKSKKSKPNPVGRPTKYSKALSDKICEKLSLGMSLRKVCLADDMPSLVTIFAWMRIYPVFLKQYARAKEEGADAMFEEINEIADETLEVIRKGAEKKSSAYAQAQRLRVDTRKWYMSKVKPKKYGEKLDLTSDNKPLPAPIYGAKSTDKV